MIEVLVVDAGPFIKGAQLEKWSRQVVTTRDVCAEIRDKATRERLQVLPYDLSVREPTVESIRHVTGFAKKTGDYGALSSADLRLLSLTYQLHCELDPLAASNLRREPLKQQVVESPGQSPVIAGFYLPKGWTGKRTKGADVLSEKGGGEGVSGESGDGCEGGGFSEEEEKCCTERVCELTLAEKGGSDVDHTEDEEVEEEGEWEEEGEGGWITPENLQRVCEEMGGVLEDTPQSLTVGCITTDFAMQNVLLQMGLNLISMEGRRIRQLRTYAKKCKGCFKVTPDTGQVWCPWCGNRSLYRVALAVDSCGQVHHHPLSAKQFSHKGLRYPLPAPKSGRHAHNPVLAPDQQVTYRERRQRGNKVDPLSQDYIALASPFAIHDVTSRGARVAMVTGGHGQDYRRRNPNAVRPKGRRKK